MHSLVAKAAVACSALAIIAGGTTSAHAASSARAPLDIIMWQPDAVVGEPWNISISLSGTGVEADTLQVEAWFRPRGGVWAPTGETGLLRRDDPSTTEEFGGTMSVIVTSLGDWTYCYRRGSGNLACGVPEITGAQGRPAYATPERLVQGISGFTYGSGNVPSGSVASQSRDFVYRLPVTVSPAADRTVALEWAYRDRSGRQVWETAATYPMVASDGKNLEVTLTRPPKKLLTKWLQSTVMTRVPISVEYRLRVPALGDLPEATSTTIRLGWWVTKSEVPKKWRWPPR